MRQDDTGGIHWTVTSSTPPEVPDVGARLTRRASRIVLATSLPLFLCVTVLAAVQYRSQRAQVLQRMTDNSATYAVALDSIAKLAHDHVSQLRSWSQDYFERPPDAPRPERRMFEPQGDAFAIEQPKDRTGVELGQVFWLGQEDPRETAAGDRRIDHALDFLGIVRTSHHSPYLQWSYFFAAEKNLAAIYPWASSADMVKAAGGGTVREAIQKWFELDVARLGRPDANPSRDLYWTPLYVDAAGAGAMVSLGSPVYAKGGFRGIVATDLTIAALGAFMSGLAREVGEVWVIDPKGMALVDTTGPPQDAPRPISAAQPRLTPALLERARVDAGAVMEGDDFAFVARNVVNAPWALVYGVSEKEIRALLLPRLAPYAVILIVLGACLAAALYFLRRELIAPALRLAAYIQSAARDHNAEIPRLPALWQDVAKVVKGAVDANAELSSRNEMHTRLMAAACHDLRQPAHALGLLAEVATAQAPSSVREPVEGIRRCSIALSDMLDMLLDMTQLEGDKYQPLMSSFAVGELLAELHQLCGPIARHKGLTLEVQSSTAFVCSDRHLLRRIMINLVSNAIKYTKEGRVQVGARLEGTHVVLYVDDTGPGIPEEKRELIFADFVRLDRASEEEGLGIGLSIVRRAADLLGHQLTLDSRVGRGTTVRVTVPLAEQDVKPQPLASAVHGNGQLVGVLENDENILSAMTQLLTLHGYSVAVGRTPEQLTQALRARGCIAPSLLVSDLHLSDGQDGLQFIQSMRMGDGWRDTKFVLLTGDLDIGVALQASALGVSMAYKPVQPMRLLQLLDDILRQPQTLHLH